MFGFLTRWRDERLLEQVISRHEESLPFEVYATQGRGTLRMVVNRLRYPADGGPGMSVTDILQMVAVILQLIVQLQGMIEEVVARIRELRA